MPKFYDYIEWDEIENRYIGLYGEPYKSIDDIPKKYRHLVIPIKPIKKLKTTTPSNPRQFFVIDMYPNKKNTSIGDVLVKPYNHDANLRIKYEIREGDTRATYNKRLQKQIDKIINNKIIK